MTRGLYQELWSYSGRFTSDKLERSELVTMAYVQGIRMGARCTLGLMKSVMHFRSKELKFRSAFDVHEVGKSAWDLWNHMAHASLQKPIDHGTLADVLLPVRTTPLDYAIVNDFLGALNQEERQVLDDLTAGYKLTEIAKRNHLRGSHLALIRQMIQQKAITYL